jgi:hypothetical protein
MDASQLNSLNRAAYTKKVAAEFVRGRQAGKHVIIVLDIDQSADEADVYNALSRALVIPSVTRVGLSIAEDVEERDPAEPVDWESR